MSNPRLFDRLAQSFLLKSLEEKDREECLRDPNLRELTKFRVLYLMTFQAPVLTPLLILLADHNGLGLALMSLGIARLTMVIFEIPMGVVADVFGAKRAAQAGLLLMSFVMLGFFGLAVFCALANQVAVEYRVGAVGTFVLQFVFGCAFALINGADDSLTEAVFKTSRLSHLTKKQTLALGKSIRYAGGMVAVGVGAAWFQVANIVPLAPPTRLMIQSGVFLATFLSVIAALVALGRIKPIRHTWAPANHVGDNGHILPTYRQILRVHWLDLRKAVSFALADKTLPLCLWWLSTLLAVAWFAAYSLQSPLTDLTANLTKESPVWISLFVAQALVGQWASSRGGRYLFEKEKIKTHNVLATNGKGSTEMIGAGVLSEAAVVREHREIFRVLFVVMTALILMAVCQAGLSLTFFTVLTLASVLCYFVRGVVEPFSSSLLGAHADQCNLEVRNALRSMNNAFVGCCFFIQVLLFGLVGSVLGRLTPDDDLGTAWGKAWQTAIASAAFIGLMTAGSMVLWLICSRRTRQSQPSRKRVVVIGSYRDDFAGLLSLCHAMSEKGINVLHPNSESAVVGEEEGFVRLNTDPCQSIEDIQWRVLALIDAADVVVLYSPQGRVGISASLELGYALKTNRRLVTTARLQDVTLRALVGDPDPTILSELGLHYEHADSCDN